MDDKLKNVLWSSVILLITLFIAWYFSRNRTATSPAAVTNADGTAPSLNFGGSSITVPPVTIPTIPPPPTTKNACCTRCASDSDMSGGKILSSGSFTDATFKSTQNAVQTVTQNPQPITQVQSTPTVPTGPMLIAQSNGGMPLPTLNWWKNDATYRQAYILAYNQVVGQLALQIQNQERPAIPNLSMTLAESSSPNGAINAAQSAGQTQLKRGGNDSRWLMEAQSNSMLMMQSMSLALNNWLKNMGDVNVTQNTNVNPPDQNVSQYLIN